MELFIKIYFWTALFGLFVRFCFMIVVDYPRELKPISLGSDCAMSIVSLAILFWAYSLVW